MIVTVPCSRALTAVPVGANEAAAKNPGIRMGSSLVIIAADLTADALGCRCLVLPAPFCPCLLQLNTPGLAIVTRIYKRRGPSVREQIAVAHLCEARRESHQHQHPRG